jgi:hypothetical protein
VCACVCVCDIPKSTFFLRNVINWILKMFDNNKIWTSCILNFFSCLWFCHNISLGFMASLEARWRKYVRIEVKASLDSTLFTKVCENAREETLILRNAFSLPPWWIFILGIKFFDVFWTFGSRFGGLDLLQIGPF